MVACALVLMALIAADAYSRGRRAERALTAAARVETLTVRVAKLDTIYRDSLKILVRWKEKWDTVVTRDTITVDSIIYVPLGPAESTLNACFAVVRSCGVAGVAKDSLNNALRAELAAVKAAQPSLRERLTRDAAAAGIGAALHAIFGR